MRREWLTIIVVASVVSLLFSDGGAVTIGWGCHRGHGVGVRSYSSQSYVSYFPGDRTRTLDFSSGAYVQLIKLVGDVDQVWDAWGTDLVDDIVLDEGHIGYALFGSGPANGEWWMAGRNVDIDVGDVIYVKAYNVPRGDVATTPLGLLNVTVTDADENFPGKTVTQTMNPENYYFDDLAVVIPEPAPLLLLVVALPLWGLRRKR